MIKYERLEQKTNKLNDVKLITDDQNGEMAEIEDAFRDYDSGDLVSFGNFEAATRNDSTNQFEFVIPGNEVGEFSDFIWDVDNGKLENLIDEWNEETLAKAETKDND